MTQVPEIGIAGIGAMGAQIALRLLATGTRVLALPGPHRTNVEIIEAAGGRLARAPSDLSQCNVLLTCLPTSDMVAGLAMEHWLPTAGPGLLHLDMTSGDHTSGANLARAYASCGARYVDVAVMGSPEQAALGELTLMIGADADASAPIRAALGGLARRFVPLGSPGAAHRAKLILAFLGMASATASAEALAAAQRCGIDLSILAGLVGETAINSATFQAMAATAIDGDESRRKLSLANASKDLRYLMQMMADLRLTTPVAEAASATLCAAEDAGHGASYVTALTRLKLSEAARADQCQSLVSDP